NRDRSRTRPGTRKVERDLVMPGALGFDEGRRHAREQVIGAAVPLGLDIAGVVVGHLHRVRPGLANADAQFGAGLNEDPTGPGKEAREVIPARAPAAGVGTAQQEATLQRVHVRDELPRRAGALMRWLVAHGDSPREKGSGAAHSTCARKTGCKTAPHNRTVWSGEYTGRRSGCRFLRPHRPHNRTVWSGEYTGEAKSDSRQSGREKLAAFSWSQGLFPGKRLKPCLTCGSGSVRGMGED